MGKAITEPAVLSSPSMPVENIPASGNLSLGSIILIIYLVGVLFFLLRMIFSYYRVIGLIANSKQQPLYKMILVITRKMVSPFSIFKWLVIPDIKTDHPDLDKIVSHEMVHYKQKHSYDLLLSEFVIAFQWFNPFAWMLKSSVVRNNEFLVDQTLTNGDIDQREYQYALLNNSVGQQNFAMVNGFSKGLIKKRIKMMNKRKTRLVNRIKEILLLPFALMIILAFSAYTNKASDNLQDQDKKKIKKEQKAEVKSQERKVVVETSWTVAKNEGRTIVDGDSWTVTEGQDQDQDKKKKKKGKDEKKYSITVDGETKILTLSEIEKTYGKKEQISIYVDGKMVTLKDASGISESLEEGAIQIMSDDDGKVRIGTTPGEGKVIYITESEGDHKKIHIRSDGEGDDFMIVIDGKVSDEEALDDLDADKIYSITILKDEDAVKEYGEKAKNGVIKIKTKTGK